MRIGRRDFLKATTFAAAALAAGEATAGVAPVERRNGMPYRALGSTGERVSLLGLGGFHIGQAHVSETEAIRLIRTALDEGVNLIDTAYIYQNGRSEQLIGKALDGGYRARAFIVTKCYTGAWDPGAALRQLEESLRRLRTDAIDVWQIHQVHEAWHPAAIRQGGLVEAMRTAQRQGKVRYLGFSGHTRPEYLTSMLDGDLGWDLVAMPTNAFDYHWVSFERTVLPLAIEKGLGVIGFKALGGSPARFVTEANAIGAAECLRYAMSLPVASVVCGMDSLPVLRENVALAKAFELLNAEEAECLRARCHLAAQSGAFESYKAPAHAAAWRAPRHYPV